MKTKVNGKLEKKYNSEFYKKVNEAIYLYTDMNLYNSDHKGIKYAVAAASRSTSIPYEIYPIAQEVLRLVEK